MSDIEIGIDIVLTSKARKTISQLNDLSRAIEKLQSMSFKTTDGAEAMSKGMIRIGETTVRTGEILRGYLDLMGEAGVDFDKLGKDVTQVNKIIAAHNTRVRLGNMVLDQFGKAMKQVAFAPTTKGFEDMAEELDKFRVYGDLGIDVLTRLSRSFRQAGIKIPVEQFRTMDIALKRNSKELLQWAYKYGTGANLVNQRLAQVRDMNRAVVATFGPMGMAVMDAAQTFFWLGLGTMFAMMSLARFKRSALAVESSNLGLLRSGMSLIRAQQELERYQMAGIVTGTRYAEALFSVKDASMGAKLAEDRLRQSIENRNLSMLMMVFGTMPTLIRSATDIFRISLKLTIARQLETEATWQQVVANMILKNSELSVAAATELVNATLMKTIILVGALTLGASALVMALGALSTKMAIDKQMASANRELAEMRELMTATHSPPLFESFKIMGENISYLTTSLRGLQRETPTAGGLSGISRRGGGVNITVTGPFYIRDKSDIDRIGDVLMRRMKNRGAY